MAVRNYPLSWPRGWPRTPLAERTSSKRFVRPGGELPSLEKVARELTKELDGLGATDAVISSSVGGLGVDTKEPGIAVYFSFRGKAMVMAQDAFNHPAGNLRSLTLAVEAMRTLERHGGGTMVERAFTGFEALPAPKGQQVAMTRVNAGQVLGVVPGCSAAEVNAAFRTAAKTAHADAGGSDARMRLITEARDVLLGDAA